MLYGTKHNEAIFTLCFCLFHRWHDDARLFVFVVADMKHDENFGHSNPIILERCRTPPPATKKRGVVSYGSSIVCSFIKFLNAVCVRVCACMVFIFNILAEKIGESATLVPHTGALCSMLSVCKGIFDVRNLAQYGLVSSNEGA